MTRRFRDILILLVAAGFASTKGPALLQHQVTGLAAELTEVPERLESVARFAVKGREGKHLGFDTYAYPGDAAMRAWKEAEIGYEWVGYYLPAPCHKGRSWVGKRERLEEMGWGTAVIYVGQQTWDGIPSNFTTVYRTTQQTKYVTRRVKQTKRVNGKLRTTYVSKRVPVKQTVRVPVRVPFDESKFGIEKCDRNLVRASRGTLEATDAIERTQSEGFVHGTTIFLDIERMEIVPPAMREYYREWTKGVLADGRYRVGYYVHKHNADLVYRDVKAVLEEAGITYEPRFWIASGRDFSPDKEPHEVGHSFAAMWQGVLDVVQEWNGYRLPIDVNVAAVPNPSAVMGD
jgi:hypothetical protein